MNFPKLFKKTNSGADQEWLIYTQDNTIITRWGQVGGKIQETVDLVREGKNVGRSNETSPTEQAEAEAQSQWEKKLKKGYVQNLTDARAGKLDKVIEGGIFPMLAARFDEHGDEVVYPCYAQPKGDGHRCVAIVKDGVCTLWSRSRKQIHSVPHIARALERMYDEDTILDGELYNHDYRDRFEELTSFIRQTGPKPGHEVVQYHVFDFVTNEPFSERFKRVQAIPPGGKIIVPMDTRQIADEGELMLALDDYQAAGYEGAIVRNAHGLYTQNKRSRDLQKLKDFMDDEFKVVDVVEGRGKLVGHAIFVCVTKEGNEFKAKMKGETERLKEYFENKYKYINKLLTVQFQGYTKRFNVPRFPVALRIRKDL